MAFLIPVFYSLFMLTSKVKGVNCVEFKLLHGEHRAYKGVNYQTMPLQCIVFSGSTRSQSAIEVILVSNEADLRADSNDSSPMCTSCKITKLFKLFLHRSEREHNIVLIYGATVQLMVQYCNSATINISAGNDAILT